MYICEPESKEDFERYYYLRWKILREPWNQPRGSEIDDELENTSTHLMVYDKDKIPIAVARLHFNSDEEAQIRFMAVDERYQRKGIGTMLLKELERRAKEKGAKYVVLNARESAIGFYKRHEYRIVGKSHTLYGALHHFRMKKYLD